MYVVCVALGSSVTVRVVCCHNRFSLSGYFSVSPVRAFKRASFEKLVHSIARPIFETATIGGIKGLADGGLPFLFVSGLICRCRAFVWHTISVRGLELTRGGRAKKAHKSLVAPLYTSETQIFFEDISFEELQGAKINLVSENLIAGTHDIAIVVVTILTACREKQGSWLMSKPQSALLSSVLHF